MGDITEWIEQARLGDQEALNQVFSAMYPELRQIARQRLSPHARDSVLDTTALVHECYLKLVGAHRLSVENRVHFVAYASTAMRSIIVDWARAARADRRGGGADHLPLNTDNGSSVAQPEEEVLDVDAALASLAKLDPRLVEVVEMRYFGGLSDDEIGLALGVTGRTVRRDWEKARMLLAHALKA